MPAAEVVITDANKDTPAVGGIFEGASFFLVQRLPSRSRFIDQIQANGGRVVKHEPQADYIIADHVRQDCPAGSISYKFIESAIKNGQLPDPTAHRAGPAAGTIRETGSAIPGKSTRTPFTAEDDRVLWQWVERKKAEGHMVKGNTIYIQLEAQNSRHTYQAWRDRYIKKLMHNPPASAKVTVDANAPPSPPTAQDEQAEITPENEVQLQQPKISAQMDGANSERPRRRAKPIAKVAKAKSPEQDSNDEDGPSEQEREIDPDPSFTEGDFDQLMFNAKDIEILPQHREEDAWDSWSQKYPLQSAHAWRKFYYEEVRPVYLQRTAELGDEKRRIEEAAHRARSESAEAEETEGSSTPQERDHSTMEKHENAVVLPERPSSSRSQTRKRKIALPVSQDPRGHKKLRTELSDVSDLGVLKSRQPVEKSRQKLRASRAASTQPIELGSSDDEQGQDSSNADVSKASHMDSEPDEAAEHEEMLPTSELNRQARAQLHDDDFGRPVIDDLPALHLQTSELNMLADQQIRRESLGEQREDIEGRRSSARKPELGSSQRSHVPNAVIDEGALGELLEPNGNLLTEANLASQQAQHKAELVRGTDLPEDEQAEDQTEYLTYLQSIMKTNGQARPDPHDAFVESSALRNETSIAVEPSSQRLSHGLDDFQLSPIGDLPMSSQQEIDEAFAENINWPESPKLSQRAVVEREVVQFETQVDYPRLPPQRPVGSQGESPSMLVGQPSTVPPVSYPLLPDVFQGEAPVEQVTTSQQTSIPAKRDRLRESPLFEQDSPYVAVSDEEGSVQSPQVAVEDEINLSIPEPDGGWDELPSSLQAGLSQPTRHGFAEQVNAPSQEIQEISSDSASSSSLSADADGHSQHIDPKVALETQDILNAETQIPDFDLPLPPDSEEDVNIDEVAGRSTAPSPTRKWSAAEDERLLQGHSKGMNAAEILDAYDLKRTKSALRNRRAILLKQVRSGKVQKRRALYDSDESEEQLPLDPLKQASSSPENSLHQWSSSPLQNPTSESQRKLAHLTSTPNEDINSYVSRMILRGDEEGSIWDALKCTSMRPDLAELVLLEKRAGKGLPADVAGIWSAQEDHTLEGGNARALERLEDKHTWDECERRLQFLQDLRADDEQEVEG